MKKISFLIYALLFSLCAISQSQISLENEMIASFIRSNEYKRVLIQTPTLGNADIERSKVVYVDEGRLKPVINIVMIYQGQVKGIIEAIFVNSKIKLPYNDKYAIQFVDYSNFSVQSRSGVVKTFDLNYDSYQSTEISLANGAITNFQHFTIPGDIALRHPADGNGNGNVSFGECMSFMQSSCNGSPNCATMCTLVNLGGLVTTVGGQCTISMAAACVYLSIKY